MIRAVTNVRIRKENLVITFVVSVKILSRDIKIEEVNVSRSYSKDTSKGVNKKRVE